MHLLYALSLISCHSQVDNATSTRGSAAETSINNQIDSKKTENNNPPQDQTTTPFDPLPIADSTEQDQANSMVSQLDENSPNLNSLEGHKLDSDDIPPHLHGLWLITQSNTPIYLGKEHKLDFKEISANQLTVKGSSALVAILESNQIKADLTIAHADPEQVFTLIRTLTAPVTIQGQLSLMNNFFSGHELSNGEISLHLRNINITEENLGYLIIPKSDGLFDKKIPPGYYQLLVTHDNNWQSPLLETTIPLVASQSNFGVFTLGDPNNAMPKLYWSDPQDQDRLFFGQLSGGESIENQIALEWRNIGYQKITNLQCRIHCDDNYLASIYLASMSSNTTDAKGEIVFDISELNTYQANSHVKSILLKVSFWRPPQDRTIIIHSDCVDEKNRHWQDRIQLHLSLAAPVYFNSLAENAHAYLLETNKAPIAFRAIDSQSSYTAIPFVASSQSTSTQTIILGTKNQLYSRYSLGLGMHPHSIEDGQVLDQKATHESYLTKIPLFYSISSPIEQGNVHYFRPEILAEDKLPQIRLIESLDTPGQAYSIRLLDSYAIIADGTSGVHIVALDHDNSMNFMTSLDTPGIAYNAAILDNILFVADGPGGITAAYVHDKGLIEIGRMNTHGITYDVLPMTLSEIYIADGANGILINNDLSNADLPGFVMNQSYAESVSIDDHYALIADSESGLAVYDITNLRQISLSHTITQLSDSESISLNASHELSLSSNFAYLADSQAGLLLIDFLDKSNPLIDRIAISGAYRVSTIDDHYAFSVGFLDSIHTLFISRYDGSQLKINQTLDLPPELVNNISTNASLGLISTNTKITVLDVSNPNLVSEMAMIDGYKHVYNTSFHGSNFYLAADGFVYYAHFNDSKQYLINKILEHIQDVRRVEVQANYLFVISANFIQQFDINIPGQPIHIDSIQLKNVQDISFKDPIAIAVMGMGGIQPFYFDAEGMRFTDGLNTNGEARKMSINEGKFFIADGSGGLKIFNINQDRTATLAAKVLIPGESLSLRLDIQNKRAYIAAGSGGLAIIDIAEPANPKMIAHIPSIFCRDLEIYGHFIFVANHEYLSIVRINEPQRPAIVDHFYLGCQINQIAIKSNKLFLACHDQGIKVISLDW